MTVVSGAYPVFDPGGRAVQKTVNSVKVMMGENMHDTAIITLRDENMDRPELQPGTPVKMNYGWMTVDTDWFYGYIDHIETHYDRSLPQGAQYEDVVCLGTSYTMKDPWVGSWTNVRCSSIVQQIAQTYYLATLLETDDYVWPQLASPGVSAWQYLVMLAKKLGYSLAVNKSLLRFVSIDTAMKANWASMPVFRSRNTAPTYLTQTIGTFQALQGETAPIPGHTKAVRTIAGLDLKSGNVIGAIDDTSSLQGNLLGTGAVYPFFGEQVSDQVVNSQGTAQATLAGMTQCNRWVYQATANLSGLTTVRQGTPLILNGIDSNNDGIWWVQEVTHKFSTPGYTMDVCLGRDSLGDNGTRPIQGTAVAYTPNNPFVYIANNNPPTVLLRNRWRAQNQMNVYVTG
jgi:phage protein D